MGAFVDEVDWLLDPNSGVLSVLTVVRRLLRFPAYSFALRRVLILMIVTLSLDSDDRCECWNTWQSCIEIKHGRVEWCVFYRQQCAEAC